MSREYKFRAWDYKNSKMLFPMSFQSGIGVNIPNEYMDYTSTEILLGCRFNTELMQFTGYLDNVGQEIYEGDIISTPYYGNLQVMFNQHSGGWIFHPTDKNAMCSPSDRVINDLFHLNYSKDVDEIMEYFNRDNNSAYLVIGNIYENPELLEYR